MNPLLQKLDSWQKHKKATSTYHHANYHYPQEFQKNKGNLKEDQFATNYHKRAKSFSKDSHKYEANNDIRIDQINTKFSEQIKSQLLKQAKKGNRQKSLKEKKQQFLRDYIKSQSQTRRSKKKSVPRIDLKFIKLNSDNRSQSKSARILPKSTRYEDNTIQFKVDSIDRKRQGKQISRQKNSKDSKFSSKNSHKKKPSQFQRPKKTHNNNNNNNNNSNNNSNNNNNKHELLLSNQLIKQKRVAHIAFKQTLTKDKQSRQQSYPMSPEQVVQRFSEHFTQNDLNEMKQYKQIYFLGRDFQSKQKKAIILSARQNKQKVIQIDNIMTKQQQKDHRYYQTENLPAGENKLLLQSQIIDDDDHNNAQFYKYVIGQHIAYRYQIMSSINRGSFGQVLKVFDHKKKQYVAIKIVKRSKDLVQQTFVEISILTHIKENDKGNTSGIVRIKDFLLFRNHIVMLLSYILQCIIFQLLDGNLYELLTANGFKGFNEDIVRLFAVQILNSLNFLRKQRIIHCDIKPQNLVMKNWGKSGIKLIDFGTSCFQGKQMYSYLQSRYYRAPQIFMQMPYSYPIDMWSFGCMMAEFKIGDALFTGRSSIEQLVYVCSCIGLPNKNDGLFSLAFLENQKMKQMLENNYLDPDGERGLMNLGQNAFYRNYDVKLKKQCMMTLEQRLSKKEPLNPQFYDFISKMLVWEPEKRMTPEEALRHPWITKGLSSQIYSLYSCFNSSESCSKSKKNSKDSKTSNTSKPKSSRQKINRVKKMQIIETDIKSAREKSRQENKINFGHKNHFQQESFLKLQSKQTIQQLIQPRKFKPNNLTSKKMA